MWGKIYNLWNLCGHCKILINKNTEKANDKFAQFYSNFEIITEASDTEVRLFISHCSVCSRLDKFLSGLIILIKMCPILNRFRPYQAVYSFYIKCKSKQCFHSLACWADGLARPIRRILICRPWNFSIIVTSILRLSWDSRLLLITYWIAPCKSWPKTQKEAPPMNLGKFVQECTDWYCHVGTRCCGSGHAMVKTLIHFCLWSKSAKFSSKGLFVLAIYKLLFD